MNVDNDVSSTQSVKSVLEEIKRAISSGSKSTDEKDNLNFDHQDDEAAEILALETIDDTPLDLEPTEETIGFDDIIPPGEQKDDVLDNIDNAVDLLEISEPDKSTSSGPAKKDNDDKLKTPEQKSSPISQPDKSNIPDSAKKDNDDKLKTPEQKVPTVNSSDESQGTDKQKTVKLPSDNVNEVRKSSDHKEDVVNDSQHEMAPNNMKNTDIKEESLHNSSVLNSESADDPSKKVRETPLQPIQPEQKSAAKTPTDHDISQQKKINTSSSNSSSTNYEKSEYNNDVAQKLKKDLDHLISEESTISTTVEIRNLIDQIHRSRKISGLPVEQGITIEELVVNMLKPELSVWLNNNLPRLVKEVVTKEIKHLVEKNLSENQ